VQNGCHTPQTWNARKTARESSDDRSVCESTYERRTLICLVFSQVGKRHIEARPSIATIVRDIVELVDARFAGTYNSPLAAKPPHILRS
jgi:hypothetical protein